MPRCDLCRDRCRNLRHVEVKDNVEEVLLIDAHVCRGCETMLKEIAFPAFELAKEIGVTPKQALVVRIMLEELDTARKRCRA